MSFPTMSFVVSTALSVSVVTALAQEAERIEFAGGAFTITETDDSEKVLAFDGKELARDYFVSLDRIAPVGGTDVAFFSVGPGGNACSPHTVMAWVPADGGIETAALNDDCDSPAVAISDYGVFFVPFLLPGANGDVHFWAPDEGFSLQGVLAYAPDPDTGWGTFDPATLSHPMDVFRNAEIYAAAQALLGDALTEVATGLSVSGKPDISADGLVSGRGCVPHACSLSDTFLVIDTKVRALFFAQQDEPANRYWPARDLWPAAAAALIPSDF